MSKRRLPALPLLLLASLLLTGCGADGPPTAPGTPRTSVTISGEAAFGIRGEL